MHLHKRINYPIAIPMDCLNPASRSSGEPVSKPPKLTQTSGRVLKIPVYIPSRRTQPHAPKDPFSHPR